MSGKGKQPMHGVNWTKYYNAPYWKPEKKTKPPCEEGRHTWRKPKKPIEGVVVQCTKCKSVIKKGEQT